MKLITAASNGTHTDLLDRHGFVIKSVVSSATTKHERAEMISDRAMRRRSPVSWRTIARRRVALVIDRDPAYSCIMDPNDPSAIY